MVDDTFIFSLSNPSPAMFDILGGVASKLDGTDSVTLIEGETVICDYTPVKVTMDVKNIGGSAGMCSATIRDNGTVLETKSVIANAGETKQAVFDNAGAGFVIAEGATVTFTVEVTQ